MCTGTPPARCGAGAQVRRDAARVHHRGDHHHRGRRGWTAGRARRQRRMLRARRPVPAALLRDHDRGHGARGRRQARRRRLAAPDGSHHGGGVRGRRRRAAQGPPACWTCRPSGATAQPLPWPPGADSPGSRLRCAPGTSRCAAHGPVGGVRCGREARPDSPNAAARAPVSRSTLTFTSAP
jgi:hypothetical protein